MAFEGFNKMRTKWTPNFPKDKAGAPSTITGTPGKARGGGLGFEEPAGSLSTKAVPSDVEESSFPELVNGMLPKGNEGGR